MLAIGQIVAGVVVVTWALSTAARGETNSAAELSNGDRFSCVKHGARSDTLEISFANDHLSLVDRYGAAFDGDVTAFWHADASSSIRDVRQTLPGAEYFYSVPGGYYACKKVR